MITAFTIMDTMKKWVEENQSISAGQWLNEALKLNVLREDVDREYILLEHELAQQKAELLSKDDMTVAKADAIIKAQDKYRDMRLLGGKIKQIEEVVRIAKKYSSISNEVWNNQR